MADATTCFKSPAGEAQYLAAYDKTLAEWPAPHEALDVATDYGTTHVNVAGAPSAPPLVRLIQFLAQRE